MAKGCTLVGVALLLYGCASRGNGPQGGPKDTTAPEIVKCTPANGSVNVAITDDMKVTIDLNENIQLDNPTKNVIFSPPMKEKPVVKSNGKRIIITYSDTLQPNTTYSINFGKSIIDNNEKNPTKEPFTFAFSTGDHVDSLMVAGTLIDARTLTPKGNITIGLQKVLDDSAFLSRKFDYIAKTDDSTGTFRITNVAEGRYRIYALNDVTQSYCYSQKGTDIAFYDSIIVPDVHLHGTIDTIWSDTTHTRYDSLVVDAHPEYIPNDILLRLFKEKVTKEYLKKSIRNNKENFTLIFGSAPTQDPVLKLLDEPDRTGWCIKETPARADSITYWLTDTLLVQKDTVRLTASYLKTDSTGALAPQLDTLSLYLKKTKKSSRKQSGDEQGAGFLGFAHNIKSELEIYDTVQITFNEPLASYDSTAIKVAMKQDTVYSIHVPSYIITDGTECIHKIWIMYHKTPGGQYKVSIDSAAITGIYGHHNKEFYKTYSHKDLEKYANLFVSFKETPTDAVVELLNNKEEVVATSVIENEEAAFQDLTPAKYYLRMFIDTNHNGIWDTGDFGEHRMPEEVYYYPKELNLRANWDVEELWPHNEIEWLKQRPSELKVKK